MSKGLRTWIVDGERVFQDSEHDGTPLLVPDHLPNEYGRGWGDSRWVFVDNEIVGIIKAFWANDIGTYASCQGNNEYPWRNRIRCHRWNTSNPETVTSSVGADGPPYAMVWESRRHDAEKVLKRLGMEITESRFSRDEWGYLSWRDPR